MFWFGLIVSLCYLPGLTGAYIATQWPVLAVLLSFALLFRSGPFTIMHGVGALFVAYAVARFCYPLPTYDGLFGLWLVVIMALGVWFGSTLATARDLYAGLAIGGAVSSAVAVAQYFGMNVVGVAYNEATRLPGLYVNPVQQGTVLALLIVALLSERMWFWVLPLLPGFFLANSRGAFLALVIGVLGLYVRRLWLFAIIGVAGLSYYMLTPLSGSDAERFAIWSAAWANLTWFGWGPGSFYTLVLNDNTHVWFPEYAHNDALQLMFEYGVGAALPSLVFGFAICRTETREWPVVLAFLVAGCYSMPLYMPLASFIALVAVGRVLRGHDLVFVNRGSRGPSFLQRRRRSEDTRGPSVSVEPAYSTARG